MKEVQKLYVLDHKKLILYIYEFGEKYNFDWDKTHELTLQKWYEKFLKEQGHDPVFCEYMMTINDKIEKR